MPSPERSDRRVGTTRVLARFGSLICCSNVSVVPVTGWLVISRLAVLSTWSWSIGLVNSTATDAFGCTPTVAAVGFGSMRVNRLRQARSLSTDDEPVNGSSSW